MLNSLILKLGDFLQKFLESETGVIVSPVLLHNLVGGVVFFVIVVVIVVVIMATHKLIGKPINGRTAMAKHLNSSTTELANSSMTELSYGPPPFDYNAPFDYNSPVDYNSPFKYPYKYPLKSPFKFVGEYKAKVDMHIAEKSILKSRKLLDAGVITQKEFDEKVKEFREKHLRVDEQE